eukprot:507709-Pelagomonas_calceolata.AAC.1
MLVENVSSAADQPESRGKWLWRPGVCCEASRLRIKAHLLASHSPLQALSEPSLSAALHHAPNFARSGRTTSTYTRKTRRAFHLVAN